MTEYTNPHGITDLILDMDGCIYEEKNFYLDVQAIYDFSEAGSALYQKRLKEVSYSLAHQEWTQKFLTGKSTVKFNEIIESRTFTPGLLPLLEAAHECNVRVTIVTSGPKELAERAIEHYNTPEKTLIHDFHANTIEIQDGKFTGKSIVPVDDKDKTSCIMDIIKDEGRIIASVGDGKPDIAIAKHAVVSVAYNSSSEELSKTADLDLPSGLLMMAQNIFYDSKKDMNHLSQSIKNPFSELKS